MFNFLTGFWSTVCSAIFCICLHSTFVLFLTKLLAPYFSCQQTCFVDTLTEHKLQFHSCEAKEIQSKRLSNSFITQLAWLHFLLLT